jgi:hypothetical protein
VAKMCCNRSCPALVPAHATHRVASPLKQPGVWNIVIADEHAEFCLSCAMTVAQQREDAWEHHKKKTEVPHG